jgi:thiamine-monophosphate kinase
MKIEKIGEFGLIDRITKKVNDKNVLIGIGDDAAVIKPNNLQVLTTDTLVEGDHFKKSWFSPQQVGMKAIEINVSDIAAMGAIPKYVLISLILPSDEDVGFIDKVYQGMWKTCKKYKMSIVGGNITHGPKTAISVTLIGEVKKKDLRLRSQAKAGDFICVTGRIGNGKAGLRLFQKNIKGYKKTKQLYLEPKAQLKLALKNTPYINAMEDISDGLASEVKHICDQSKVGAIIYKDNIPISDEVRQIAKKLKQDPYDYALFGGEDFQLVFTVKEKNLNKVKGFLVGEITKKKGVRIYTKGKEMKIKKKGYDHFINPIKILN